MQTIVNSIDFTLNISNSVSVTFFRILITYLCIDKQVCGITKTEHGRYKCIELRIN